MRDNLFKSVYTDGFLDLARAAVPQVDGQQTPPPTTDVQPKVLLAHFEADAAGSVTLNTSLGVPVVTTWRDKLNGYELTAPSVSQSPMWVSASTMASQRPALLFDGVDTWLDAALPLRQKLTNLSGLSITMVVAVSPPDVGGTERLFYVSADSAGTTRFGYANSAIDANRFYHDGATLDTDPYAYATGGSPPTYEGWAVHTVLRDYLNAKATTTWNGEAKINAVTIGTPIYSGATTPSLVRLGAGYNGQSPAIMHLYALKVYTYALSNTEVGADNTYGLGRVNS